LSSVKQAARAFLDALVQDHDFTIAEFRATYKNQSQIHGAKVAKKGLKTFLKASSKYLLGRVDDAVYKLLKSEKNQKSLGVLTLSHILAMEKLQARGMKKFALIQSKYALDGSLSYAEFESLEADLLGEGNSEFKRGGLMAIGWAFKQASVGNLEIEDRLQQKFLTKEYERLVDQDLLRGLMLFSQKDREQVQAKADASIEVAKKIKAKAELAHTDWARVQGLTLAVSKYKEALALLDPILQQGTELTEQQNFTAADLAFDIHDKLALLYADELWDCEMAIKHIGACIRLGRTAGEFPEQALLQRLVKLYYKRLEELRWEEGAVKFRDDAVRGLNELIEMSQNELFRNDLDREIEKMKALRLPVPNEDAFLKSPGNPAYKVEHAWKQRYGNLSKIPSTGEKGKYHPNVRLSENPGDPIRGIDTAAKTAFFREARQVLIATDSFQALLGEPKDLVTVQKRGSIGLGIIIYPSLPPSAKQKKKQSPKAELRALDRRAAKATAHLTKDVNVKGGEAGYLFQSYHEIKSLVAEMERLRSASNNKTFQNSLSESLFHLYDCLGTIHVYLDKFETAIPFYQAALSLSSPAVKAKMRNGVESRLIRASIAAIPLKPIEDQQKSKQALVELMDGFLEKYSDKQRKRKKVSEHEAMLRSNRNTFLGIGNDFVVAMPPVDTKVRVPETFKPILDAFKQHSAIRKSHYEIARDFPNLGGELSLRLYLPRQHVNQIPEAERTKANVVYYSSIQVVESEGIKLEGVNEEEKREIKTRLEEAFATFGRGEIPQKRLTMMEIASRLKSARRYLAVGGEDVFPYWREDIPVDSYVEVGISFRERL
jgi:hypothetical protein